ncbi:MAG: serine hydrolase [Patescibacteria group bacterium]
MAEVRQKDFIDSEFQSGKKRPRKTIGEEGPRKQTLIGLIATILLGLMFYLPTEFKKWWREWNQPEVIRIEKPIGDQKELSEAVGFKVEIKQKTDVVTAMEKILGNLNGDYGVYVKSLTGNEELKINENKIMTAASVIKLPVLALYYQAVDEGKLDQEEVYSLLEKDRWVYGTGSMQGQPAGTKYSYKQIAYLVANQSDNMGAEVLIKKLGGYSAAQKKVGALGLEKTDLNKNETTTAEAGKLLEEIAKKKLLTDASRAELFKNLTNTVLEDRIPAGVPSGIEVQHKFGSETGVVNDCGIVRAKKPYVICVMSTGINDGEAQVVLPKISRVIWEWLGDN